MTNICAAIGLAQLEQVKKIIDKKIEIALEYKKYLPTSIFTFQTEMPHMFHTYWMVSILIEDPSKRDKLIDYLLKKGIETRPLFYPVHTFPMYKTNKSDNEFLIAKDISRRGLNLPSHPSLKSREIKLICKEICNFFDVSK